MCGIWEAGERQTFPSGQRVTETWAFLQQQPMIISSFPHGKAVVQWQCLDGSSPASGGLLIPPSPSLGQRQTVPRWAAAAALSQGLFLDAKPRAAPPALPAGSSVLNALY